MEEIRKDLQKEIENKFNIFSTNMDSIEEFIHKYNPKDYQKKEDGLDEIHEKIKELSDLKNENQDTSENKESIELLRKTLDLFYSTTNAINSDNDSKQLGSEKIKTIAREYMERKISLQYELSRSIQNSENNSKFNIMIDSENIASIKNIIRQYNDEFSNSSEFVNKSLKMIIEWYQRDEVRKISQIQKECFSTYFGRTNFEVIDKVLGTGLTWWINPKKGLETFENEFDLIPQGIKNLFEKDIPKVYHQLLENMEEEKYINTKYIEFEKIFTDDKVIDSVCNIYFKPKNLSVEQIDYIHNKKDNSGKEKFIDSSLNRFFPIKFCLLLLAFEIYSKNASNDIVEEYVDYSDFSNKLRWFSVEFSRVIDDYDKKNRNTRREDKKNTGFPSSETEKNGDTSEQTQTSKRFTDTYLGKIEKNGEFTPGKLYDLGLIDFFYVNAEGKRTERSGKLVIQFSMEGQSLINLHKKISLISTEKEFFNDKEREFIINHIKVNFELEYKIIRTILDNISKWDNSEMQMGDWDKIKEAREKERERNKDLENEIEKTINEWKSNDEKDLSEKKKIISDSKLRAIRISTIGRLVDLGLIVWTAEKNVNKYTIDLKKLKEFDIKIISILSMYDKLKIVN